VKVTSPLAFADALLPSVGAIKNTAAAIADRPLSMNRFEIMRLFIQRDSSLRGRGLSISLFVSIVINPESARDERFETSTIVCASVICNDARRIRVRSENR
jgi:hypothetical protein